MDYFFQEAEVFCHHILKECQERLPSLSHFPVDHFCYKTAKINEYNKIKNEMLQKGHTLLSEVSIAGRPISTFKLLQPLVSIPLFELAAPKDGDLRGSRFDHIERFFGTDLSFSQIIEETSLPSDLTWDTSDSKKIINPDISLKLKNGIIKFHQHSLEAIIQWEKEQEHQK
jgi:predicted metalloenzyme YecM